jgi:hypothetical protein
MGIDFDLRYFDGLTITYDLRERVTQVDYFADAAKTAPLNSFTITYDTNGDPIYLGETLIGHKFEISSGTFILNVNAPPNITEVFMTPSATVIETGTDIFDINWTFSVNGAIGQLQTVGGTSPFTWLILDDPDDKFDLVSDVLVLNNSFNIFASSSHSVIVRVEDDVGKTALLPLTFNLVSTIFNNANSFEFLGSGENLVSNVVNANPTGTAFSVSFWFNRQLSNEVICGRWNNLNECMFYVGMDGQRPRMWISGDGTAGDFQSRRTIVQPPINEWHHFCFTYLGGNEIDVYFDGSLNNGNTGGSVQASMFNSATQVLEIGQLASGNPGGDGDQSGFLEEMSFWDVELSAAEVTEIYNGGVPADLSLHSQVANLLEWSRMGDMAVATGLQELVSGGTTIYQYANGSLASDISTNVPP